MASRKTHQEMEAEVLAAAARYGTLDREYNQMVKDISRRVTAMDKTGVSMPELDAFAIGLLKKKQKKHDQILSAHHRLCILARRYASYQEVQ